MNHSVMLANITWNPYRWQSPYVDPRAGHEYARIHPGHESLNFDFNKEGIDDETHVYGFSQWNSFPRYFSNGGDIIFYTRNLDENIGQVVGIFGGVEIIKPSRKFHHERFENKTLEFNMLAEKALSLLFPIPLDSRDYKEGRFVGQIGFAYSNEAMLKAIVLNERALLQQTGGFPDEIATLNRILVKLAGIQLM